MKVVYTEVISDVAPAVQTGLHGTSYTAGEKLVVYEEEGKYYYFLDCVSASGLAYETDDVGPFETLTAAVSHAYKSYEKYKNPQ